MSAGPGKRSISMREPARMGLFVQAYEIMCAPLDPSGNNDLRRFVEAFVLTRFQDGIVLDAQIGRNHALVLTERNCYRERYECVLGEYSFVRSMSSPQTMSRLFYAEFPAYSARLAAFMERCNYGEEYLRFAENIDTNRVAEDNPQWLLDPESNIAYYVVFKMGGLINKGKGHVLFSAPEVDQLGHFLTTVLTPRAAHQRPATQSHRRVVW
jgi:hypothetical protein